MLRAILDITWKDQSKTTWESYTHYRYHQGYETEICWPLFSKKKMSW